MQGVQEPGYLLVHAPTVEQGHVVAQELVHPFGLSLANSNVGEVHVSWNGGALVEAEHDLPHDIVKGLRQVNENDCLRLLVDLVRNASRLQDVRVRHHRSQKHLCTISTPLHSPTANG